jgi:uncharacterized cupin superfamily protein
VQARLYESGAAESSALSAAAWRLRPWRHTATVSGETSEGPNASSEFEGETEFEQLGIFLRVLGPGVPMGLYHREADQEGFLVLSGQALLIVEGEERPLRQRDFFHCPPGTKHTIVGTGTTPCVVLAVGAREHQRGAEWGAYTVHDVALRYGAGVEEETSDRARAHALLPKSEASAYRDGWLPGYLSSSRLPKPRW